MRREIDAKLLERLRKAVQAGTSVAEIASAFGISKAHLWDLIQRHGWRQAA